MLVLVCSITRSQSYDCVQSNGSLRSIEPTGKISSIDLVTSNPIKILNLVVFIKNHPSRKNEWPKFVLPPDYPNEKHPILGTFPDGTLLRDYLILNGSLDFSDWFKPQIEEFFKRNSNERFQVEVLFPKNKDGKVYETTTSYENWIAKNNGSKEGFIMRFQNWRGTAEEVLTKAINNDPGLMSGVKLLNIIYKIVWFLSIMK